MRFVLLAVLSVVYGVAQTASSPHSSVMIEIGKDGSQVTDNSQLHADVLKLIEVDGTRQRMVDNLPQVINSGQAVLVKQGACNSAFAREWSRRMLARIDVDQLVGIVEATYEKYFTDSEIRELIAWRSAKPALPPSAISDQLRHKVDSVIVSYQSDVLGESAKMGAKLGGEIARQVEAEHPEYCRSAVQSRKQ